MRRSTITAHGCTALLLPLLASACAPAANLRPIGSFAMGNDAEVGAAFAAIGPRPYAAEDWRGTGQGWGTIRVSPALTLSAVTAFDASGFALGGAANFSFLRTSALNLGVGAEVGLLWAAVTLPVSVRIVDEFRVYTAPRLGSWGDEWAGSIPLGVSVPLYDGLALRAEGQAIWPHFVYYNRRFIAAGGLAYQW